VNEKIKNNAQKKKVEKCKKLTKVSDRLKKD
jgi:hypothetical protein